MSFISDATLLRQMPKRSEEAVKRNFAFTIEFSNQFWENACVDVEYLILLH